MYFITSYDYLATDNPADIPIDSIALNNAWRGRVSLSFKKAK